MPNIHETLKQMKIEAGGPGSGRHPDFDKMHSLLISKGFKTTANLNNLRPDAKMVEYSIKGKFGDSTKSTSHRITVALNGKNSPYTGDNAWQHRAKEGKTTYSTTKGAGSTPDSLAIHLARFKK